MPTPSDVVELKVNGLTHSKWERYEIDSDLLTPADGWSVGLGIAGGKAPLGVQEGMPISLSIGGELVLTGHIDDIEHGVRKDGHTFSLSGRDLAGDLLDCSAPLFTAKQVSLKEIVAKIKSDFNFNFDIRADATLIREKISIEPGDSVWDALAHAAEANGLWPWFEPDGTLVVGGPDYSAPVVAHLIMRQSGNGENNLISLTRHGSMQGRYSDVTVLGQAHGTALNPAANYSSTWTDNELVSMGRYRPKIITDHECDSKAVCRGRAQKYISDGRLNGLTLSAVVRGHRIRAPKQPSDGMLWKPGMRVMITSEPHNIKEQVFFLMARKFAHIKFNGKQTILTLKEDGVWCTNAHPHNNKHRRGKNDPGQIIELG